MALVNGHRLFVPVLLIPCVLPFGIGPLKSGKICGNGCGTGSELSLICIGVRLVELGSILCIDKEFVHLSGNDALDEYGPDADWTELFHLTLGFVPSVP